MAGGARFYRLEGRLNDLGLKTVQHGLTVVQAEVDGMGKKLGMNVIVNCGSIIANSLLAWLT